MGWTWLCFLRSKLYSTGWDHLHSVALLQKPLQIWGLCQLGSEQLKNDPPDEHSLNLPGTSTAAQGPSSHAFPPQLCACGSCKTTRLSCGQEPLILKSPSRNQNGMCNHSLALKDPPRSAVLLGTTAGKPLNWGGMVPTQVAGSTTSTFRAFLTTEVPVVINSFLSSPSQRGGAKFKHVATQTERKTEGFEKWP